MTIRHCARALRATPLLLVLLAPGCTIGGIRTDGTLARLPAGVRVDLSLDRGRLVGELLEVRDDGLLIHVDGSVSVALHGPVIFLAGEALPEEFRAGTDYPVGTERGRLVRWDRSPDRDWLRRFSRFPYGLSPDVEARLLEAYGQTSIGTVAGAAAPAPTGVGSASAFMDDIADGAALYRDRRVAIRHGYRRVGPDFPGMGEHWVNPGLVLSGGIDPARPQILTYVDVEGGTRLTGVAFAMPLSADESVPSGPLPADAWHDHGGSLDEEALILESPHTDDHGGEGPRLAMVHAWLWPENPEGPFAQNNWTLSWVRAGLAVPDRPDPVLARALFLAGDGADYYRRLLRRTADLTATEGSAPAAIAIDEAVDRAALRTRAVIEALESERLSPSQGETLRAAWRDLWVDLRDGVDPETWRRLRPAFDEWGGAADHRGAGSVRHDAVDEVLDRGQGLDDGNAGR